MQEQRTLVTTVFGNGLVKNNYTSVERAFFLQSLPHAVVPEDTEIFALHTINDVFFVPSLIYINVHKPLILPEELPLNKTNLYTRDKGICGYCGEHITFSKATIDHIIPKSKGGKHRWRNVILSCMPCNTRKGDRTPEQAGLTLRSKPTVPKNGKH